MFFRLTKLYPPNTGKKQTGVAIITALLIVTIATTISISISTQLQLDIRRTGNLVALDQADMYVSLVEKLAEQALTKKVPFDALMDNLRLNGVFQVPYLVDNAKILGEITDLNSCININTLLDSDATPPTIDAIVQARLNRLFTNNGIAPAMITSLYDWMDAGSEPAPFDIYNGAEDGYYLNLEQPYHTANQTLFSFTETRLIKGANVPIGNQITYTVIRKLSEAILNNTDGGPTLCAFDTSASTSPPQINVNTASRQVLQSLSKDMNAADVATIINCRAGPDGVAFAKINDFYQCGALAGSTGIGGKITAAERKQLDVTSDYFLLKTTISLGNIKKIIYSTIYRKPAGTTQIISRTQRTL